MRKKIECTVCGARFAACKDALYQTAEKPASLSVLLSQSARLLECFDCPKCGCQNVVNIRVGAAPARSEEGEDIA